MDRFTAYDYQSSLYDIATMKNVNIMITTVFDSLVEAGFGGTIADIGFTSFMLAE